MGTKQKLKTDLTLEALADLQVPSGLRISPDGSKVLYALRSWTKKREIATSSIWMADIGKERSARQFTSGLFNDEQPQWSPDGTSIAFKSDRGQPGKTSALYVMSLGGGEARPVTPAYNESPISAFEWSPNGAFIAYTSADEKSPQRISDEKEKNDANVWGSDQKYGRLRYVHMGTGDIHTLDLDGHVHDFSWSPDSKEIVSIQQQDPDINSSILDPATISIVSLTSENPTFSTSFRYLIASHLTWSDSGIYFTAYRPSISSSLSQFSIQRGHWTRKTSQESCCISLQKNQSSIAYRVQCSLNDELFIIHEGGDERVYCGEHEIASFDVFKNERSTVIVITKGDGSNPEEVFSTSGSQSPVKLSDHNSAIAALRIAKARPISATATDGYSLDGVMYLPSKYELEDGPLPTILLPHGGPYHRVTVAFSVCHCLEVPLLTSAGYAVVCPNYRGGSGRGRDHALYSHGAVGTVDYTDCIDVLRNCIDKGIVDPSRVAISGWSQGGYLSYLAATRNNFQFRGAVCGAGIVDWDVMTMTSDAHCFAADLAGGAPWDVDENSKYDDTTGSEKSWIRQANDRSGHPIWHMRNIKTPILILHGEEDVRVPLSQAVAFYRGCKRNNIQVKMVTYPREGHQFVERNHVMDLWKRMRQFYDVQLA